MLFNKQTQQAFVFPPKNGTHSAVHFLTAVGWKRIEADINVRKRHLTPDVLIQMYPNLNNYTLYGFLRNPLKRFESVLLHLKQFPYTRLQYEKFLEEQGATPREQISYDEMIRLIPVMPSNYDIMFKPQVAWLTHPKVTVLDFDAYESELRRISGDTTTPLIRYNASNDFGKSQVTPFMVDYVKTQYAADCALWKDLFGREIA
jgi:hypothetical protein